MTPDELVAVASPLHFQSLESSNNLHLPKSQNPKSSTTIQKTDSSVAKVSESKDMINE